MYKHFKKATASLVTVFFLIAVTACSTLTTTAGSGLLLKTESVISFSDDITGGPENGWSPSPDSGGTWSASDQAFLQLRYEDEFKDGLNLNIRMSAFVNEKNPNVTLVLTGNGIEVSEINFDEKSSGGDYLVVLGPDVLAKSPGNIKLGFEITNAASPKDLGISEDLRKLGIFLIQITPLGA